MDKITLQYPVKLATGVELKEINLRRPKVRDLKHAQKNEQAEEQELALLSSLTAEKLTIEDLEELDLADYANIQQVFQTMVGKQGRYKGDAREVGTVVSVPAE